MMRSSIFYVTCCVLCGAWCTMQKVMDAIKKFYVTQYHGFEPLEICAATLLFEGSDEEVRAATVIGMSLPACAIC